jgi:hypothetical protein
MFSDDDAKDIFRLFPPQKSNDFLPNLILSSGGHGFVTLVFVQAQFRSRVTKGLFFRMTDKTWAKNAPDTNRISVKSLATELDVDSDLVLQLVRTHGGLALLSADGASIITADERDIIHEEFRKSLDQGLVTKSEFAASHDIDARSVQILVDSLSEAAIRMGDQVCGAEWQNRLSSTIEQMLKNGLEKAE